MEIIASAILGRSSFTFGLSRIIRFYLQVGALSIKQDLQTRPRNVHQIRSRFLHFLHAPLTLQT